MIRFARFAALIGFLTGCMSIQPAQPRNETGYFPELNTETTVSVGEVMVTQYDYLSVAGAVLREDAPGSGWMARNPARAGTSLLAAMSGGQQMYCEPPGRQRQPCFRDTNGDGRFDRAYSINPYGLVHNGQNIDPVSYRLADQSIQDGFKYELIYQGIDGNVVRIAYREYTDNLARPAYSQDLSYTLESEGATRVRFRSVAILIHMANNNEITYIVESGF